MTDKPKINGNSFDYITVDDALSISDELLTGAVANNSNMISGIWIHKTPDDVLSEMQDVLEQTNFVKVRLSQPLHEDMKHLGIKIDFEFDKMLLTAITEEGQKNLKLLLDRFNENMFKAIDKHIEQQLES